MKILSLAILNIGMLSGWIYLAVHFDKWWIALFALFTVFSQTKE